MARRPPESTIGLQQIDEVDGMKLSLNNKGDNLNGTAINGNKPAKNEGIGMRNANLNLGDLQSNIGNSGALVIKNTTKMLIGLAVAGMVAMATIFGSVSADSPSVSTSFTPTGPNEMEPAYLNKLGMGYVNLGPDIVKKSTASVFRIYGPDVAERATASAFRTYGPDVTSGNVFWLDAPGLMGRSTASAHINLGPDVVTNNTVSAFRIYEPDVADTGYVFWLDAPGLMERSSTANAFRIYGPRRCGDHSAQRPCQPRPRRCPADQRQRLPDTRPRRC
jgi:hypothetical protein